MSKEVDIPKYETKKSRRKRCKACGKLMDEIWCTTLKREVWVFTGSGYDECREFDNLIDCPQMKVICPECGADAGLGFDFGFGGGKKGKAIWQRRGYL